MQNLIAGGTRRYPARPADNKGHSQGGVMITRVQDRSRRSRRIGTGPTPARSEGTGTRTSHAPHDERRSDAVAQLIAAGQNESIGRAPPV